jgi:UDP-glucose 4-epimerase
MARYLVTGGAGFIGSHICEALVRRGEEVVVLDNLDTGKKKNLIPAQKGPGRLTFIQDDVRDISACRRAAEKLDYVLHLAARPSVKRSIDDPVLSHEVNVTGGLNVLMAAKESGVKRVVCASSSSVYGDREPLDAAKAESLDPRPQSPYAANKLAMETYCAVFCKVFGLETVSLRYFNVFGPRQEPDSAYAAVIPRFLFALLDGKAPTVFGDGRQSRDFTYVDNVVAASLAACTAPGAAGQAFNVASGVSHDLLYLIEVLSRLTGRQAEPQFLPPRPGDVRYSLADLARAREVLGYQVKISFEQGLSWIVDRAKKGAYFSA